MRKDVSRREAIVSIVILAAGAALETTYTAEARGIASHKIRYMLNGGKLTKGMPKTVRADSFRLLSWIPKPEKRGYKFAGWFKDAKFKAKATKVIGSHSKTGRTIYAKWTPKTYSISYDTNDGKLSSSARASYTIETPTFVLPDAVKLENERLTGWIAGGKGNDKPMTELKRGTVGDLSLRAAWEPRWSEGSEQRAMAAAADNAKGALTLLHFSDIHGSAANLQRIVEFMNRYPDVVDAAVCTGDLVTARFSDGMDFWDSVAGSKRIMTCIGNHDSLASQDWDWKDQHDMTTCAKRYIDPYIVNWGTNINHPEGATYYSRLFANQGIRLIVLDCMLKNADATSQMTWLESQFDEAVKENVAVIIASHYPTTCSAELDCSFTSPRSPWTRNNTMPSCRKAMQHFIDSGGEFICCLSGHLHRDGILYSTETAGQYDVNISCASSDSGQTFYDNTMREAGRFSQDLFNLVTVDRDAGTVTLRRIGADKDGNGSPRSSMTFDYRSGRILSEG